MSCYETHRGILRKVDTEGKSVREFLHDIALGEDEEIQFDEEENFCEVTPLEDGSIKVFAQFYNGDCCLEELLEDKLK